MRSGPVAIIAALALAVAGCATAYGRGVAALDQERYEDATRHFEDAIARDPERLDARIGLGIAQFRLGAADRAADILQPVVHDDPDAVDARLYLALSLIRLHRDGAARAELTALRQLPMPARTCAQIDRVLGLLGSDLADPVREFVVAALEDELVWAAEVHEARRVPRAYLEPTWVIWWDHHWLDPVRCPPTRPAR
jgi:tetratricopeptide (TPR) repeat protein